MADESPLCLKIKEKGFENIPMDTNDTFMALYLLEQNEKGDSKFKKWLDVLPSDFNNFPIFFTDDELDYLIGSPFKDYLSGENKFYISNGVVNPAALAYFWFKHQNIVRVEYLSGFEESSETVYLKDKSNPYEQGPQKAITRRNVNKPVWRIVNKELLDSLSDPTSSVKKVLCRLVRYNYSYYINKKLVNEANLPLVNNYFILSQQSTDTGDNVITPGQAIGETQLNTGPVQVIAQDPSNLQAPGGPLPGLLPGGGT